VNDRVLGRQQYEEGYATAIARTFDDLTLNMAQRQLERFERAGALASSLRGRTRLYTWNPRYPFRRELRALLRQYFPKGTDLSACSQADLNRTALQLNQRPRKTPGFRSPAEVLNERVALTG
jgi:IS30 family transposase